MNEYEELLAKHGYIKEATIGENGEMEPIIVSIDEECACIRTLQKNGWQRINIYYPDGTLEELYEK